jgi:hypothetical protein
VDTTNGGGTPAGATITFSSTLNGVEPLTLTAGTGGAIALQGAVGGTTPVTSVTASGTTITLQSVTTSGAQSYTGATTLNGNLTTSGGAILVSGAGTLATGAITVDTTNGGGTPAGATITFSSTLNGAEPLTLTAGTGDITWTGAVGGTTPLGAITINSARNLTESAGLTAASVSQAAGTGTTTLNGAVNTTAAGGVSIVTNAIAVNSEIMTTGTGPVILNAGGALTIAAAGTITSDGAVALTGGSGITTAADVTTTGDAIAFNSATTLSGSVTLNSANGPITLGSTVSGTAGGGAETLTLNAGTGALNVNGVFGAGGVADATGLTTLTITDAGATTFNGAIAITGTLTQTNAATGATTFGGTVSVGPTTLRGTSFSINNSFVSSGAISFSGSGAITGTGTLTSGSTLSLNASSVGTAASPLALGAIPGEISGALTASADANGFNISSTGVIHIGLIDAAPAGGTARNVLLVSTAVGSPQIDLGSGTGTDIKADQVTFFAPTKIGEASNRLVVSANTIRTGIAVGGSTGSCLETGSPQCFLASPGGASLGSAGTNTETLDTLLSSILSSMTKDKAESMSELLTSGLLPENVSKCLVYGAGGDEDGCGGDSPVGVAEGIENARK